MRTPTPASPEAGGERVPAGVESSQAVWVTGARGQWLGSSVQSGKENMSLEKPAAVVCVRRAVPTGTCPGQLSLPHRGCQGDSQGEAPGGAAGPGEHDYLQLLFGVLPQSLLKASCSVPKRLALEGQRVYLVL